MNYNNYYRQAPPLPNHTPINKAGDSKPQTAPNFFLDDNLFLNIGKYCEVHMSFPDSIKERDRVFKGIIHEAVQDHIVIHDKEKNEWYMLPLIYVNYVLFRERTLAYSNTGTY